MITEFLPSNCQATDDDNPFKQFLDNTIGYFLDVVDEQTDELNTSMFVQESVGKFLDLHGVDYNLKRLPNESDEDYRNRLLLDSLDRFTFEWLYELFDLQLLTYNDDYEDNMLLSDNHYLNNQYFIDCTDEIWNVINRKFVVLDRLVRFNDE